MAPSNMMLLLACLLCYDKHKDLDTNMGGIINGISQNAYDIIEARL
jgi:hypothetical protein